MLRRWFGPSKDEVWAQLAEQIGAEFVEGGFWKGSTVVARVKDWTVTLDTYAVSTGKTTIVYTRMRAPYVNPNGFQFTIYRRGLFSGVSKWLGGQDIEIGEPEFDDAFIIKGTDTMTVQQLLSNPRIRQLIREQPEVHFDVKDDEGWFGADFPEGVDALSFVVVGVIKDVDRLKRLFDLFAETLQHLCRVGAAYDQDPRVTL